MFILCVYIHINILVTLLFSMYNLLRFVYKNMHGLFILNKLHKCNKIAWVYETVNKCPINIHENFPFLAKPFSLSRQGAYTEKVPILQWLHHHYILKNYAFFIFYSKPLFRNIIQMGKNAGFVVTSQPFKPINCFLWAVLQRIFSFRWLFKISKATEIVK